MIIRKIACSIREGARELARPTAQTPQYRQSRSERKKVEMLFAHLKRIMKLDQLRGSGSSASGGANHRNDLLPLKSLNALARRELSSVRRGWVKRVVIVPKLMAAEIFSELGIVRPSPHAPGVMVSTMDA